jgi:hypothetical protein
MNRLGVLAYLKNLSKKISKIVVRRKISPINKSMIMFIICSLAKPDKISEGVITLNADKNAMAITKVNPGPTISKYNEKMIKSIANKTSIASIPIYVHFKKIS